MNLKSTNPKDLRLGKLLERYDYIEPFNKKKSTWNAAQKGPLFKYKTKSKKLFLLSESIIFLSKIFILAVLLNKIICREILNTLFNF
jgi:hypothetical protein